jgi:putative tricarboxylic transport membrane protein
VTRLGWTDSYLGAPAFEEFLDSERVRIARIVSRLRGAAGGTTAARAGEWLFPVAVLGGSASVLIMLVLKRRNTRQDPRAKTAPVMRVVFGLVAFVAVLNLAGFVAAGTVLFSSTAAAFGSRRWQRDALLGLVLSATVYITFTYGLGVPLPAAAVPGTR